jgi:DNA uptake protein ComE-like DNA-binding protein
MKKSQVMLLAGVAMGLGTYLLLKYVAQTRRVANIHLTTQDLDYQDLSPEDLVSDHLIDLNGADDAQLRELGLDPQSLERLIENRPYRSKLELVSRMVLSEALYTTIKNRVAVAAGREPVKVA